jgi:hypothetical protein
MFVLDGFDDPFQKTNSRPSFIVENQFEYPFEFM